MEIALLILEILTAAGGVALFFYVRFNNSYFKKKGENLATKEDVAAITKEIETVKSQVQFSLQSSLSWRAEEHEALVNCYLKLNSHMEFLDSPGFNSFDSMNVDDAMNKIHSQMEQSENEFSIAVIQMKLFVDNDKITVLATQLHSDCFAEHSEIYKFSANLHVECLKLINAREAKPYDKEKVLALIGNISNLKKERVHRWFKQRESLNPLLVEFMTEVRAHLKSLLKPDNTEKNN